MRLTQSNMISTIDESCRLVDDFLALFEIEDNYGNREVTHDEFMQYSNAHMNLHTSIFHLLVSTLQVTDVIAEKKRDVVVRILEMLSFTSAAYAGIDETQRPLIDSIFGKATKKSFAQERGRSAGKKGAAARREIAKESWKEKFQSLTREILTKNPDASHKIILEKVTKIFEQQNAKLPKDRALSPVISDIMEEMDISRDKRSRLNRSRRKTI